MNVLLVSQCSGRALQETRRILDQFAERKGERAWQTPITEAGLDTLRKLLRQKARKNTAVACHWIRGKDHSELLWIVGNANRFNTSGVVPTNRTRHDILRSDDENDWHTGEEIKLTAAMAALMHDLGKACKAFQDRINGKTDPTQKNLIRHEWVSLRLFQAFVGDDNDENWLGRLANPEEITEQVFLGRLHHDGPSSGKGCPLAELPPVAAAIGWLILSHHRLPAKPAEGNHRHAGKLKSLSEPELRNLLSSIDAEWNEPWPDHEETAFEPYWSFPGPLPVTTSKWQTQASKVARRLLNRLPQNGDWLDNPYLIHLSRLSLMLADHHYSSLTEKQSRLDGAKDYPLFANTNRTTRELNQPLDEHILGVMKTSMEVAHHLPTVEKHLPRLARHKGFRKRTKNTRFRWQDHAFDLAESLRQKTEESGFFGINMASTGCGKTLANGRILYALADPQRGTRFSIALGLRTLTLQTGQAYRARMGLGEDQLAVRVGGAANRNLYEHYESLAAEAGSASTQSLLDEDSFVHFEGNVDSHPVLSRLVEDPHARSLLSAPILTCTVDHLIPATEALKGGRQIAPMLRLMSSDLVLDEIDDFSLDDMHALTRLTYWAGMLGTRVILSSATITPDLAQGLFDAYRAGREEYQKNRCEPGRPVNICCAWFDENNRDTYDCSSCEEFLQAHNTFAGKRCRHLAKATVRRRGEIATQLPTFNHTNEITEGLANLFLEHCKTLHEHHANLDPNSEKRVSFGLIRMANINPLTDVARTLFELEGIAGMRIHLCVYHSQHPLLVRSEIEYQLDQVLNRSGPDPNAVFESPLIANRLNRYPEKDQIFLVLGSPVTEVGRDHDYDWAIVEPSSLRSLIQLAGRVKRHRDQACDRPNVIVLNKNLRALQTPGQPAFQKPGFEDHHPWELNSHELQDLVRNEEYQVIDSRPRIVRRTELNPNESLVDLEHARLKDLLVSERKGGEDGSKNNSTSGLHRRRNPRKSEGRSPLRAYSFHQLPKVHLTGVLQQWKPFRAGSPQVELALLPDESEEDFVLHQADDQSKGKETVWREVEKSKLIRIELSMPENGTISPWIETDYTTLLTQLAEEMDMDLQSCAERFGRVSLASNDKDSDAWQFHPLIGFSRSRQ